MKTLLVLATAAIVSLSFGACQTTATNSAKDKSGDCGGCCKSENKTVKKLSFR